MLPTIAFKRRSKPNSNKNKSRTSSRVANTKVTSGFRLKPWMAISLILILAGVGIAILRFSRASTGELNTIPTNLSDIQTTVNSLIDGSAPAQDISARNYVDLTYTPSGAKPAKVVYYLDGTRLGESTNSPYNLTINTNQLSNNSHSLTIVSFDSGNNVIAAKQANLKVDNTGGIVNGITNVLTYPWHALFKL